MNLAEAAQQGDLAYVKTVLDAGGNTEDKVSIHLSLLLVVW